MMPNDNTSMDGQHVWTPSSRSITRIGHSGSPSHPETQTLSVSEPGSPILSSQERPTFAPYRSRSKTLSSATPTPYLLRRFDPPSMISSATAMSDLPLDPSRYTSTVKPGLFPMDSDGVQQRKRGRTSSFRYQDIQRHQPLSADEVHFVYNQRGHIGSQPQLLGAENHGHSLNYGPLPPLPPTFALPAEEPMVNFQNKRPLDMSPPLFAKAKRLPESRILETLPFNQQQNSSEYRQTLGTAGHQSTLLSKTEYVVEMQRAESGRRSASAGNVSPIQVPPIREGILKKTRGGPPGQHRQHESTTPDSSYGNMLPPASHRRSSPTTPHTPRRTKHGSSTTKGRTPGGSPPEGAGSGKTAASMNDLSGSSSSTDISSTLVTQLGKLLISTKQHIMDLLLSFLSKEGHRIGIPLEAK